MMASGVDPEKSVLFVQSSVRAHTELTWIFDSVARMGWLEKMIQFKEKSGKDAERASVGLFNYPVLQAADILAYKATHVPVGEDQKQHLELSRNIADRFNRDFDAPDFFPLPEALIEGPGARIMSLKDGAKKMSKSDPAENSRINLIDDADIVALKADILATGLSVAELVSTAWASASTHSSAAPRSAASRAPTVSSSGVRSAATTVAPRSAAGIAALPVPAAMSRTRSPGPTVTASTTTSPRPGMSSAATAG